MILKRFVFMFSLLCFFLNSIPVTADIDPEENSEYEVYTLDELYNMALKQSEAMKIAKEEVLIAEKDKGRALSVFMPRFTAFGSYSRIDVDQDTDLKELYWETYDLKTDNFTWGVRLDQSFTLNGKEITALNISRENIRKSESDLVTSRENILIDVATTYYNVLRAQKGWEIAKANVKRLEKHKESVSARLKVSDVTLTDMYRAESELSDAKARLVEDRNRFILSKSALRTLVSIPPDFKVRETAEMDFVLTEEIKNDELTQDGIYDRTELRSAEIDRLIAEKSIKVAKGDRWPVLSIEGQYAKTKEKNDGSMLDPYTMGNISKEYDKDISGFIIGARLTFTLFDGGLRNAQIKQAYARERQARLVIEALKKKIGLEIQEARLYVETQKSRFISLKDKLVFAERNFNAVSEQFKQGFSNSVDMMDANTLLSASEREVSDAEFSYKLAVLKLKRALGISIRDTKPQASL